MEPAKKLLPRVRVHTVSEERVVRDEIHDKRLQLGQKVEVVFRKPIKKKVKAKPTECPDKVALWLLSDKEEDAGFYEAALIHRWAPFEYGLKHIKWMKSPDKGWPINLHPQDYLSWPMQHQLKVRDQIKVNIYATSTITDLKKDSDHKTAKSLLSELKLRKTVKDWRNAIVHEGARIDQNVYQVCKKLIESSWKNLALNSDDW